MKIKEFVMEDDTADAGITNKPKSPEQSKLDNLQAAADRAKDTVKQERKRQSVAKMAKNVAALSAPKPSISK